jgi:hypothetical protein
MQMPTLPLVIMIAGLLGTLFVLYSAFAGPSPPAQARAGSKSCASGTAGRAT